MSYSTPMSQAMQECIQACLTCHATCLSAAMNHCLVAGGRHTEPAHFRLMMSCVTICKTSADFMSIGTDLHKKTCALCAEICRLCAESCDEVGGMEHCASVCRHCADHCGAMAA